MRFAVTRGDSAELDHSAFLSDLDFIVADFAGLDLKDLDIGEFLTSLLNLARKNDVELPSVVTMFARGMVSLEGLLTEYMPNVNMIQIIQTHIKNEKSAYARVREMGRDLAASSYRAAKGSLEAAEYLGLASRMLTRGQLKVNTQIMSSDKALRQLGGIIRPHVDGYCYRRLVYRFVGGVLRAHRAGCVRYPGHWLYGLRERAGAGAYAGPQYLAQQPRRQALEAATVTAFSFRKQ